MKKISLRVLARIFGIALPLSMLTGCTTNTYETYTPPLPPPPDVQYAPPPAPAPPPPPVQPDYTPPPVVYIPPPPPVVVIDIHTDSDFYEPLGNYGRWVDVDGYGRCWIPNGVDPDWRPYTQGHWERTDDGWFWASDEPWGWATYHYGRWFLDPNWGWVWVPQTQWAPAWVAWRDGDDYTGWAPLPPRAQFRPDGGLEHPDADVDPHSFCFVEKRRMMEPQRPQTVIVNNITVIQKTVNITKITVVNKTVINEGPPPDAIARATGRQINVQPAHVLRNQHEAPVIAKDHLRTTTVQPVSIRQPAQNHPEPQQNQTHVVRPNEPHPPQPAPAPEQPRQPSPAPTIVHSAPQLQPPPHPPAAEVNHQPQPVNRPAPRPENNQPPVHAVSNQPKPEPNTLARPPVQPAVTPQQQQEQERQQELQKQQALQKQQEALKQQELQKQQEQQRQQEAQRQQEQQKQQELQKQQQLQKQQKAPEKPHPQTEPNHHSSTNAPPEHR